MRLAKVIMPPKRRLNAAQYGYVALTVLAAGATFYLLGRAQPFPRSTLAATALMTVVLVAFDLKARLPLRSERFQLSFGGLITISGLPFAGPVPVAIANAVSQLLDRRLFPLQRIVSAATFVVMIGITWGIWAALGGPAEGNWPGGGVRLPDFLWQLALADLAFTLGSQIFAQATSRILLPDYPYRTTFFGAVKQFVVRFLFPSFAEPYLLEIAMVVLIAEAPWWAIASLLAYLWRVTDMALLGVDAEISKQELTAAQERASTDPLTGVRNRSFLEAEIDKRLDHHESFCLVLLDIDDFKMYNDQYGHTQGDAVLKEVSQTLVDNLRSTDVVGRYGGDEFCLILTGAAYAWSPRLDSLWETVRKETGVTLSGGCVIHPGPYTDRTALFEAADRMLYKAKELGKDRWMMEEDDEAAR